MFLGLTYKSKYLPVYGRYFVGIAINEIIKVLITSKVQNWKFLKNNSKNTFNCQIIINIIYLGANINSD